MKSAAVNLCGFFLAFFLSASFAFAQSPFKVPDLSIEMSPEYPRPGDTVRLRLSSDLANLQSSSIRWLVNNVETSRGNGLTEFSITAPTLGFSTTVEAIVESGDEEWNAEALVRPAELDLLWESDSYVPPFYRGRALPSAGSKIRAEAFVQMKSEDGTFIAARNIVFTWKRNGALIKNASGLGKSSALFDAPGLYGSDTISVEARAKDGESAYSSERISSTEPRITLYPDHPLFGILYHKALSSSSRLDESEVSFAAVPYFAAGSSARDPRFSYAWSVNGLPLSPDPKAPDHITIDATGSTGIARIALELSDSANLFLNARNTWDVALSTRSARDPFSGDEL